jgi:hypothetical protein
MKIHESYLFAVIVRKVEAASIRCSNKIVGCDNNGGILYRVQIRQNVAPDRSLEYFNTRVSANVSSVASQRCAMVYEIHKKLIGIRRRSDDVHAVER